MEKKFLKDIRLGVRKNHFQYLDATLNKGTFWLQWAKIVVRSEGDKKDIQESHGTIQLFLAASELLEALKELEEKTTKLMTALVDSPEEINIDVTIQKARQAIKKATI